MQRITRTAARFVCFVMLAGVCLHAVPAFAADLTTTDADTACSNTDLLQDPGVVWSGNLSGIYVQPEGGTEPLLRDGVAAADVPAVWASLDKPHQGWPLGSIWVYTLDTSVNTGGYDLSEVNLFFGELPAQRNQMAVKVEYSKVGSDTFDVLYDMGWNRYTAPSGNGKISIQAGDGEATGVDAVKFSWAAVWTQEDIDTGAPNPTFATLNNGASPVSEIDVLGTPTAALTGTVIIVR